MAATADQSTGLAVDCRRHRRTDPARVLPGLQLPVFRPLFADRVLLYRRAERVRFLVARFQGQRLDRLDLAGTEPAACICQSMANDVARPGLPDRRSFPGLVCAGILSEV